MFGAGLRKPLGDYFSLRRFTLDAHYGVGITEELGVRGPLLLTFGGPVAEGLELSAMAGLTGIGLSLSDDVVVELGGALGARAELGDRAAALTHVYAARPTVHNGLPRAGAAAALVFDATDWLSFGFGGQLGVLLAGADTSRTAVLSLGGDYYLNNVGVPLVAVHAGDGVDFVLNASWNKGLESPFNVVRGTIGISFRGEVPAAAP